MIYRPMLFIPVLVLIFELIHMNALLNPVLAEQADHKDHVMTRVRSLMGTEVVVKLHSQNQGEADSAFRAVFDEFERLEGMMSSYIPTSGVSKINRMASAVAVETDRELFELLEKSIYFSVLTEGAFDITFSSVGMLWDFRKGIVPSPEAIQEIISRVNYKNIRLDKAKHTIRMTRKGMSIGLGGIGKGYAVDRAISILSDHGFHNAMVMAGGDTVIRGKKGDEPWTVGLRDPRHKDRILAVLPLEDIAISTSGDYERFFVLDGIRYHHILNPKTGYPARASTSVTILAPEASTSDPLATAIFVMGPTRGMELINRIQDVEAIIIDPEGDLHLSTGLVNLEFNP